MHRIAYLMRVQDALRARKADAALTDDEKAAIWAALKYGVGPDDCACQIIANRADAAELRAFLFQIDQWERA